MIEDMVERESHDKAIEIQAEEIARLRAALAERDTALRNANAIIGAQADENDRTVKGVLAKLAERDALLGEAIETLDSRARYILAKLNKSAG